MVTIGHETQYLQILLNLRQHQDLTDHIAVSCTLVPFDVKRGGDGKEVGHPIILLHTISYGNT
jgi:hypothetical protein